MKQTYIDTETLNMKEQEVVINNDKIDQEFKQKDEEENIQIHDDQLEFKF